MWPVSNRVAHEVVCQFSQEILVNDLLTLNNSTEKHTSYATGVGTVSIRDAQNQHSSINMDFRSKAFRDLRVANTEGPKQALYSVKILELIRYRPTTHSTGAAIASLSWCFLQCKLCGFAPPG
jgi:hypothetical protein